LWCVRSAFIQRYKVVDNFFLISNGRYIDCLSLTYATSVVIKVIIVIRRKCSQFSIIFILASQYRSHSVLLVNAAHCPRGFLSMGSRKFHSMQKGSARIAMRWRSVPKQSCPTHNRNSATAFLLGQPGVLAISCLHGFWTSFISSSCLYALWNTCVVRKKCIK
jgi:hypothetical protein